MDNFIVRLLGGLLITGIFTCIALVALATLNWRNVTQVVQPRLRVVRAAMKLPNRRHHPPLTTQEVHRFATLFDEEESRSVFSDVNKLMEVHFLRISEEKEEVKKRRRHIAAEIKRQEKKGMATEWRFATKLYHTHQQLTSAEERHEEDLETIEEIANSVKNHIFNTYMENTRCDIRLRISLILRGLDRKRSLQARHKGGTTEGEGG